VERGASEAVELWWLDLDSWAAQDPTWDLMLTHEELQRAQAFAFPHLQHRYRATRALLRVILAHYCGRDPRELALLRSTAGKPRIEQCGNLDFNLSHSGPSALVAVTRGQSRRVPVGIDLEHLRSDLDWQGISSQIFHPVEQAALCAEDWRTFFTLWTRKEAWLKAVGTGWIDQSKQVSTITENWKPEQNVWQQLRTEQGDWWVQSPSPPESQSGEWAVGLCLGEVNLPVCWQAPEELGCLWERWCQT